MVGKTDNFIGLKWLDLAKSKNILRKTHKNIVEKLHKNLLEKLHKNVVEKQYTPLAYDRKIT